uniref:Uncharacterized protein n=1 Tax=Arundo donax TaxID=35708 RepID=A0A0A9FC46_ARUDO
MPNDIGLAYQDDNCDGGCQVQVNEENFEIDDPDDVVDCEIVDASVVDDLRRQREEEVQEYESSDDEDETGLQYASDNEGPTISDEDDSDSE